MADACDIRVAQKVALAVQRHLEKLSSPPEAPEALVRFHDLTAPIQPPSWVKESWSETFPNLSLAKALDRLAKSFPALGIRELFAFPEVEDVLTAFHFGKIKPREVEDRLADFFSRMGYDEVATVVRFPFLSLFPRPFGFRAPKPSERTATSPKVSPVDQLSERSRKLLEEVRNNPEQWPRVMALLEEQVDRTVALAEQILKFRGEVESILVRHKILPSAADDMTLPELIAYGVERGGKEVREELSQAFKKSGLSAVSDDPVEVFFKEVLRAAQEDIRERIDNLPKVLPPILHEIWDKTAAPIRKFSREFSISRPGYVLMQLLQDGIIKPLMAGYGSVIPRVLLEFRSFYRLWSWGLDLRISPSVLREGGFVGRSGLDLELSKHGIRELPEEITADLERDLNFFELQAFRAEASSIWEIPVFGPLFRGQLPFVNKDIPIWKRVTKSRFYPLNWLARFSAWVSVMARAQEAATRKAIFGSAFLGRFWSHEFPILRSQLRALGERWNLPFDLGQVLEEGLKAKGRFKVSDVREVVDRAYISHFKARNPVLLDMVESLWKQRIESAIRYGVEEAQRINYDYLRRTVGDDILSWIFKFHFWASRNLPFYLEEFLRHRTLYRVWVRTRVQQMEEEEEGKRSPRLGQALEVFDLALFGSTQLFFIDLFDLISVTTQLSLLSEVDEARSPWETVTRTGGSLTFSPHWDISVLMWVLGYDLRADPPTPAPPLAALLRMAGLPPLPLLGPVLQEMRSALSGRLPGTQKRWASETLTGSPGLDRAIWIELIIMSYERTGRPDHPRYVRAFATPDDPLFQEARDRVLARTRIEQGAYLLFPQRVLIEPETQQALRALRAEVGWEELSPEERRQLILQSDPAAWTAFIPRDLREAQIRSAEAAMQLDRLSGKDLPLQYYISRYPWYGDYLLWREKQRTADRSVSRYIEETR